MYPDFFPPPALQCTTRSTLVALPSLQRKPKGAPTNDAGKGSAAPAKKKQKKAPSEGGGLKKTPKIAKTTSPAANIPPGGAVAVQTARADPASAAGAVAASSGTSQINGVSGASAANDASAVRGGAVTAAAPAVPVAPSASGAQGPNVTPLGAAGAVVSLGSVQAAVPATTGVGEGNEVDAADAGMGDVSDSGSGGVGKSAGGEKSTKNVAKPAAVAAAALTAGWDPIVEAATSRFEEGAEELLYGSPAPKRTHVFSSTETVLESTRLLLLALLFAFALCRSDSRDVEHSESANVCAAVVFSACFFFGPLCHQVLVVKRL